MCNIRRGGELVTEVFFEEITLSITSTEKRLFFFSGFVFRNPFPKTKSLFFGLLAFGLGNCEKKSKKGYVLGYPARY